MKFSYFVQDFGPFVAVGAALFCALSCAQTQPAAPDPVFDVPALVGKNISGVLDAAPVQGADLDPHELDRMKKSFPSWNLSWKKSGQTMFISFVPATGEVEDFFIPSDEPDGATADVGRLREIGNLDERATNYTVEPIRAPRVPGEYTGIKITPTK